MSDQIIDSKYSEQILVQLSVQQNGNAVIVTQHDSAGNRTGYASAYPIDLSGYDAALHALVVQELTTYAATKQTSIANGGLSVTLNEGTSAQKIVSADTEITGRTNLSGLVAMAQMNKDFTTVWMQSSGALVLNAAEIMQVGVAVGEFVADTYLTLSQVVTGISNGSVTTQAAIDTANWPLNA